MVPCWLIYMVSAIAGDLLVGGVLNPVDELRQVVRPEEVQSAVLGGREVVELVDTTEGYQPDSCRNTR